MNIGPLDTTPSIGINKYTGSKKEVRKLKHNVTFL